jgi:hypothetical protein
MASAFYGVSYAWLEETRDLYLGAIQGLATAQSYNLAVVARDGVQSSRSVTRSDLPSIKATLSEILEEIRRQDGLATGRTAYADFTYFAQ